LRPRSRCRNIKLVVTNQVQYDHRWSHRSRSCTAVGIWSTKLTTWEGESGEGWSDPRSEDGRTRMERSCAPSLDLFFHHVWSTSGVDRVSFPSLRRNSGTKKHAVWRMTRSQRARRIAITRARSRQCDAIRYTPLGRQLRTMHRATGKKKRR